MGARVSTQEEVSEAAEEYLRTLVARPKLTQSPRWVQTTATTHVMDLLDKFDSLFPRSDFNDYRDWQNANKEFDQFWTVLPEVVKKVQTLAAYERMYPDELTMLTVGGKFVYDMNSQFQQRISGVYPAIFMLVERLTRLHKAWLDFLVNGRISRAFREAAHLEFIEVLDDSPQIIFPSELRAVTVLNYFVRKWTELTHSDEYTKWIADMEDEDARFEFKYLLYRRIQDARVSNVIVSESMANKFQADLVRADELWDAYLTSSSLTAVPCVIVIGTHGSVRLETESDFTADVPGDASVTRIVRTPPGYINRYVQQDFKKILYAVSVKYRDAVTRGRSLTSADLMLLLTKFTPEEYSQQDIFSMSYVGNLDKTFAKRYLSRQPYLNKQYSVSVEEYERDKKTVTLFVNGEQKDVLDRAYRKHRHQPEAQLETDLQSVIREAMQYRQDGQAMDIMVLDFSCSVFHIAPALPPLREQAGAGMLGYESDTQFKRRVRGIVEDRGLTGGS
jgi:hypothetical protein